MPDVPTVKDVVILSRPVMLVVPTVEDVVLVSGPLVAVVLTMEDNLCLHLLCLLCQ